MFSDMSSIGDRVSTKKQSGCLVEVNIFYIILFLCHVCNPVHRIEMAYNHVMIPEFFVIIDFEQIGLLE